MPPASDTIAAAEAGRLLRKERRFARINKAAGWLDALGFAWVTPLLKIAAGENVGEQLGELKRVLLIPLLGIGMFILAWGMLAPRVDTSLGALPAPAPVWEPGHNPLRAHT